MSSEVYTVQPGDTLSGIAGRYNTTVEALMGINPQLENADMIFAGQPINVPLAEIPTGDSDIPWFEIAKSEIGIMEIEGPAHHPRILQYHATTSLAATADEVAWCSAFVNWCIERAGLRGTKSAAAKSWLNWTAGRRLSEPTAGCIVVLDRGSQPWQGHVGFYAGEAGPDYLYLLGGNQSDMVRVSKYSRSDVVGYIMPRDRI